VAAAGNGNDRWYWEGNRNKQLGTGGSGLTKDIPAHVYFLDHIWSVTMLTFNRLTSNRNSSYLSPSAPKLYWWNIPERFIKYVYRLFWSTHGHAEAQTDGRMKPKNIMPATPDDGWGIKQSKHQQLTCNTSRSSSTCFGLQRNAETSAYTIDRIFPILLDIIWLNLVLKILHNAIAQRYKIGSACFLPLQYTTEHRCKECADTAFTLKL